MTPSFPARRSSDLPGVGHAHDDRILATALRNGFFQFLHSLRAFAPGRAVGRQHQRQLGADLLTQRAAGKLGEFLEFAGIHQSAFLPGSLPERLSSFFSSVFTRRSSFLMSSRSDERRVGKVLVIPFSTRWLELP